MKIRVTALLISLSMMFVLGGCGGSASAATVSSETAVPSSAPTTSNASASVPEKDAVAPITLRLEGGNIGTPNPFRHTARGPGIARMQLLYDSLLEKDENDDIPWLAERWELSDDGTVYTFYLRENAVWHDGEPLTADDVAFTFTYYKDHPPVSNTLLADGQYIVASTEALDEHTVKMTLNRFNNTLLSAVGSVRILPRHIWEGISDPTTYDGEGVTVGSGPYKVESFDETQGIYRYVAFENYWGLTPAAEAIEWVPVSDAILAFENGEIDIINASADLLPRYQNDSEFAVKTVPSLHSFRLMMNMESVPALQDVAFRQAIAYAVDKEKLIETVARGSATVSSMGYIPTDSVWYNPDITQYPKDADKARMLLDGKTSYSFKLLTDNTGTSTKTAELIKIDLADVGIDVTVESVESKTRDNAIKTGDYELLLVNSGGMGGDPDFLRGVYGAGAKMIKGWQNQTVADLLTKQAIERDADARKAEVYEAQKLISEDVPMIMLYGAVDNFTYRPDKYAGWMCRYDHNKVDHNKLSYLIRES